MGIGEWTAEREVLVSWKRDEKLAFGGVFGGARQVRSE